jgi:hypothetical protein
MGQHHRGTSDVARTKFAVSIHGPPLLFRSFPSRHNRVEGDSLIGPNATVVQLSLRSDMGER